MPYIEHKIAFERHFTQNKGVESEGLTVAFNSSFPKSVI